MWDQLQSRAKKTNGDGNIASGMSYETVKDRTSAVVGSDGDGGILFDETIAAYTHRRKTAEEYLVTALIDSHQKAFRPYVAKTQWAIVDDTTHGKPASLVLLILNVLMHIVVEPSQLSVTPDLDEPLKVFPPKIQGGPRLCTDAFLDT